MSDIGSKIIQAFLGSDNHMRTIGGVARETGLPVEQVEAFILKHTELFHESELTPSGTSVYVYTPGLEVSI